MRERKKEKATGSQKLFEQYYKISNNNECHQSIERKFLNNLKQDT
jgi:hypothetical protein